MRQMNLCVGGCAIALLCAISAMVVMLSLFVSLIVSVSGSAHGAGGDPCLSASPTATPGIGSTASPSRLMTATPGDGHCLPASGVAAAVVHLAEQMANALYVNPACHGTISYPNCY